MSAVLSKCTFLRNVCISGTCCRVLIFRRNYILVLTWRAYCNVRKRLVYLLVNPIISIQYLPPSFWVQRDTHTYHAHAFGESVKKGSCKNITIDFTIYNTHRKSKRCVISVGCNVVVTHYFALNYSCRITRFMVWTRAFLKIINPIKCIYFSHPNKFFEYKNNQLYISMLDEIFSW